MMRFFVRLLLILFVCACLIISMVRAIGIHFNQQATIQAFFDDTTYCTTEHCIMGIIPQQTATSEIDDLLTHHDFVENYNIIIQFGLNIEWRWNATPPDFMVRDGFVSLSNGYVDYVLLRPRLTVGDIWATFGEPAGITSNIINTTLYYPQYGFNVLVTLDCRASWYSPVAIEYRTVSSAPPPTIDFEAARQTYCH